jgi:hypothetical protein
VCAPPLTASALRHRTMKKKKSSRAAKLSAAPAAEAVPEALRRLVTFDASAFALDETEIENALLEPARQPALEALFGARELRELRDLAEQVRSQASVRTTRRRVLILPGIMGSKLGRRRKLFGTDTVWIEPFDLITGGLAKLALPRPGTDYHAIGVLVSTYLLIRMRLRSAGFDADFHPFDWRRPIADLGRELAERIAEDPAAEIWLVAHSMGGLVARAALRDPRTKKVRRLIQLGTPNYGSFSPVMALRGVHSLAKKIAMIDLKNSNTRLTEEVFSTFPGLYEMLPAPERYARQDLFDPASWPARGLRPRAEILAQTRNLSSRLAPPDKRVVLIAGINQETIIATRIEDGEFHFEASPAGDGTVPLDLARLDGVPTYYVDGGEHGALPRNGRVLKATLELLEGGVPSELPDTLPSALRTAGVRSLSESALARHEPVARRAAALSPEDFRGLLSGFCAGDDRGEAPFTVEIASGLAAGGPIAGPSSSDLAPSAGGAGAGAATSATAVVTAGERLVFGRRRQHRLDVRLVQGSITQVEARAYVVGLLREVAPGGAAAAIDEILGGAIHEFTQRRMFAGNVGEVFILPKGRSPLRAEMVLFAGLGTFDTFNSTVLRLVAENVVRTFVHTRVEDFATVLVGGGSSLSTDEAVTALFEGFVHGLLEADTDHRFRSVTLCEPNPERCAHIRRRLFELFGSPLCRDVEITFDEPPPPPEVAAATPAERAARPATRPAPVYLLVRGEPAAAGQLRLHTSVLTAGRKAAVLSRTQEIPLAELQRQIRALPPNGARTLAQLRQTGDQLAQLLLPPDLRAALGDLDPRQHVVVVHDLDGSRVPWEALPLGGHEPARSGGMSRRFLTERLSIAKWRAERQRTADLSVLLVVNPTLDLPGTEKEAAAVQRILGSAPRVRLARLDGPEATRRRLLEHLGSGQFDIMHYAGHAFFDAVTPGRCGLVCAGHEILTGADLANVHHLPSLFFYNACQSARVRSAQTTAAAAVSPLAEEETRSTALATTSLAEALLIGGAANFVGTYWEVGDAPAARFADTFYRQLASGESVGRALVLSRQLLHTDGAVDWADYIHYGDPEFRLKVRAGR